MTVDHNAAMVFARVQLRAPGARSILVTSPHFTGHEGVLAAQLADAVIEAGLRARLLDVSAGPKRPTPQSGPGPQPERMDVLAVELGDPNRARRVLNWNGEGYTIVSADGVLDRPHTLILAASVDIVLVVVSRKTLREDLVSVRGEITSVGGNIVGAVMVR